MAESVANVAKLFINTGSVLRELGLEFVYGEEGGVEPEPCGRRLGDVYPELCASCSGGRLCSLCGEELYRHQCEAIKALENGRNLVLVAGTGSGKTEAWLLYALNRSLAARRNGGRFRTLVVYPTKALEHDQAARIAEYFRDLGFRVEEREGALIGDMFYIDADVWDRLVYAMGRKLLVERLVDAYVVATNPEMLRSELNRCGGGDYGDTRLREFVRRVDMVVVDELDYYRGARATMLLETIFLLIRCSRARAPQFVVMSGTLSGVSTLKDLLERFTGRETVVIEGRGFAARNRTYVVVGRRDKLVEAHRALLSLLARPGAREFLGSLRSLRGVRVEDFEEFKGVAIGLLYELDAVPIPRDLFDDVARVKRALEDAVRGLDEYVPELARRYACDGAATLVFTNRIVDAERLARKTRELMRNVAEPGYADVCGEVAVHHSEMDRDERARVEEGVRQGKVRVVFTVRTLQHGIDIGEVLRVVHVGLPPDVRDYLQREGRKGRRRGIEYTETVIFPTNPDARAILSRGLETLRKWIELGPELTWVNPDSLYVKLYRTLAKLHVGDREGIDEDARRLAEKMGLVTRRENGALTLSDCGNYEFGRFWIYSHSGRRRIGVELEDVDGRRKPVDVHVNMSDLARLQPGYVHYLGEGDGVVKEVELGGESVTVVEVEPRRFAALATSGVLPECLVGAYNEYVRICSRWGQDPDFAGDVRSGRLWAEYCPVVEIRPLDRDRGFGMYRVWPREVRWVVESRRVVLDRDRGVYRKPLETIQIRCRPRPGNCLSGAISCNGNAALSRLCYEDYTYYHITDLDPEDAANLDQLEVGLELVKAVLRARHGVSIDHIKWFLDARVLKVLESDPVGLIDALRRGGFVDTRGVRVDCGTLLREISGLQIDETLLLLVSQSHRRVWRRLMELLYLSGEGSVKQLAIKALSYICDTAVVELRSLVERLAGLGTVWGQLLLSARPPEGHVVVDWVRAGPGEGVSEGYALYAHGYAHPQVYWDFADFAKDLHESIMKSLEVVKVLHYGNRELVERLVREYPAIRRVATFVDVHAELTKALNYGGPLPLSAVDEAVRASRLGGRIPGEPLRVLEVELANNPETAKVESIKTRLIRLAETRVRTIAMTYQIVQALNKI